MRSTEEIYQDLKLKYEKTILKSKNQKEYRLTLQGLGHIVSTVFLWIIAFFVFFGIILISNSDGATASQIILLLLKHASLPILIAILSTFFCKHKLNALQRKDKQFSSRNLTYKKTVISNLVKEICPTVEYERCYCRWYSIL